MSKKKITLIGDIHGDNNHMPKVIDYIRKKLTKDNRALLALEELDNPDLPIILRNSSPEQNKSQRPSRSASTRKTEAQKINALTLLNRDTQQDYKNFFGELLQEINSNKQNQREFYIDQVDDNTGIPNEYSTKRDVNMRDKIIDLMTTHKLNRAIYPVGSAHIFNKDDKKSGINGSRLATLLKNDTKNNIDLKLKNFYPPEDTTSYNAVQEDIDNFYNHHKIPPENKANSINQKHQWEIDKSQPNWPNSIYLKRTTTNPAPRTTKKAKYAGGGYIINNNSYDPYLNNDNYEPQLTLSDYLANQMSDSEYDTGDGENSYTPYTNTDETEGQQYSFREGGSVERENLPRLAELIREQGRDGDTELAHINPIEAHILKSLGGSGTINPKTGLSEFWPKGGFLGNPLKAIAGSLGGGAGAVIGNMIMPGLGGIIGGALGGAAGSAVRGRKDYMGAGLRGAAMGAMLPSAASAAGWGANAMGAKGLGTTLTNYGNTNAILPSIGLGGSSGGQYASPAATMMSLNGMGGESASPVQYMQAPAVDNRSFMEKLGDNSKDYLTQPSNLLALGTAYAQYAGREKAVKPKTPEQLADEERRYRNASRLTPAELEAEEAYNFARKEAARKLKYNAIREKLGEIGSLHRKVNSPEEYEEKGRWLEYYDNPEFAGEPIRMKDGGNVHSPYNYMTEEVALPNSLIGYLQGNTGGQDDLIDAKLSDGEYVIDAATVSDLGDGNNGAGARKLDAFRERVRRHKRGGKISLPPKSKSLEYYLRG